MDSKQIKWNDINNTTINHCKYGTFRTYCFLIDSCDECNKKIRFLCKVKNGIEQLQRKIITKELNKRV